MLGAHLLARYQALESDRQHTREAFDGAGMCALYGTGIFTDTRMKQKQSSLKERKQESVDWDNIPSPNPRYRGLSVKEAARILLRRSPKKPK